MLESLPKAAISDQFSDGTKRDSKVIAPDVQIGAVPKPVVLAYSYCRTLVEIENKSSSTWYLSKPI